MEQAVGQGRGVRLKELIDAGILKPGETLVWQRRLLRKSYEVKVTVEGNIQLKDGRIVASPSKAAVAVSGSQTLNGWLAWHVGGVKGPSLSALRAKLAK